MEGPAASKRASAAQSIQIVNTNNKHVIIIILINICIIRINISIIIISTTSTKHTTNTNHEASQRRLVRAAAERSEQVVELRAAERGEAVGAGPEPQKCTSKGDRTTGRSVETQALLTEKNLDPVVISYALTYLCSSESPRASRFAGDGPGQRGRAAASGGGPSVITITIYIYIYMYYIYIYIYWIVVYYICCIYRERDIGLQ